MGEEGRKEIEDLGRFVYGFEANLRDHLSLLDSNLKDLGLGLGLFNYK